MATDVETEELPDVTDSINPDNLPHIFCWCRPKVMLCGAFYDGPLDGHKIDGTECPECRRVLAASGGCPNCRPS